MQNQLSTHNAICQFLSMVYLILNVHYASRLIEKYLLKDLWVESLVHGDELREVLSQAAPRPSKGICIVNPVRYKRGEGLP